MLQVVTAHAKDPTKTTPIPHTPSHLRIPLRFPTQPNMAPHHDSVLELTHPWTAAPSGGGQHSCWSKRRAMSAAESVAESHCSSDWWFCCPTAVDLSHSHSLKWAAAAMMAMATVSSPLVPAAPKHRSNKDCWTERAVCESLPSAKQEGIVSSVSSPGHCRKGFVTVALVCPHWFGTLDTVPRRQLHSHCP